MSKPYIAYFIDAKNQTVKEASVSELSDVQKLVEGLIEVAVRLPGQDVLYVNEEGIYMGFNYGFCLDGSGPFFGNGVVVGTKNDGDSTNPKTSLEDAKAAVKFMSFATIDELDE